MRVCVRSVVGSLCLWAVATSANAASNLVVNPNFDLNVLGWTVQNPGVSNLVWVGSQSAVGTASSGSGLLTAPVNAGNWNTFSTCVTYNFPAGSSWDFGGWVRIPSLQTGSGSAGIGVVFYNTTDCTLDQPPVIGDFISAQVWLDVWNFYTRKVVLPSTAHSASVYINIDQNTNNASFGSYFDGLFLTDRIFSHGFDGL